MNKTLIAMAVAGLMAAPMAAQADATIYGKIHTSIDFGDNDGTDVDPTATTPGTKASSTYWQNNSSRIGFKGSEDLGGGLKAIWQFESNASFGSGNETWGLRNSFVGLQGGWGTLVGGRHDTPMKTTGRKFDLFGDYVGDSRNLINGRDKAGNGSNVGFDLRPENVLVYKTPVFGGGWDITAAYVLEDGTQDQSVLSANVNWKTGNWYTSLAYETHGQGWNSDPLNNANDESLIRLGVKWTPGAWILTALYQTGSDADGVSGADGDAYGIGAGYKMGKNVIKAQYYTTSNDAPAGTVGGVDATLMAVAWDYNFSKRTTGYIAYSTTDNDENVAYSTDGGGHGGEIGVAGVNADPSAFSLGVIHKF